MRTFDSTSAITPVTLGWRPKPRLSIFNHSPIILKVEGVSVKPSRRLAGWKLVRWTAAMALLLGFTAGAQTTYQPKVQRRPGKIKPGSRGVGLHAHRICP